jgi:hypothetical protein
LISIQGQEGQIGKERITQSFTTKPWSSLKFATKFSIACVLFSEIFYVHY